jgi:hypothetical protein
MFAWHANFHSTLFSFGELLDPTHSIWHFGCSGIYGILVTFEWCLLCTLTLLYPILVWWIVGPDHFVCYQGCSVMLTFEWCLLGTLTSILLYSRLVDCWTQLILCVIKTAHGTVVSWLLWNGALLTRWLLFQSILAWWIFELHWYRLAMVWALGNYMLSNKVSLQNMTFLWK